MSKLLGNSIRTVSNWKSESRPIILLLERYFSKNDLVEFLETGAVSKYEKNKIANSIFDEIEQEYAKYILTDSPCKFKAYFHLLANIESSTSLETAKYKLFDYLKSGDLNQYDIVNYFENVNFSPSLLQYINFNIKTNWQVLKNGSLKGWFIDYHELSVEAAKEGHYQNMFCGTSTFEKMVPNPPRYNTSLDNEISYGWVIYGLLKKIKSSSFKIEELPTTTLDKRYDHNNEELKTFEKFYKE